MLTHVNDGKLSLQRFVELTRAGPQRVFGLADKGRIAEGYHADFTIVDLSRTQTLTSHCLAMGPSAPASQERGKGSAPLNPSPVSTGEEGPTAGGRGR